MGLVLAQPFVPFSNQMILTKRLRTGPCLGGCSIDALAFPAGIMLAVSCILRIAATVKASVAIKLKTRMEYNMTTIIQMMCVVAATALLGRSVDMFPKLQGDARIAVALSV